MAFREQIHRIGNGPGAANRANAEALMCDKCVEIDQKIEHYRSIAALLRDQLTKERIAELITDLLAQKSALHPEQDQ